MADRSILTIVNGQIQNQSSSDNLVLAAPLDVNGKEIYCAGDIKLVATNNDNIICGSTHATNNSELCFIGGGYASTLNNSSRAFIGGGYSHTINTSNDAVILGGYNNDILANSGNSTIVGGANNVTSNTYATVLGGVSNNASGNCSVAGGDSSVASGNNSLALGVSTTANAVGATALGSTTLASGDYSLAVGLTSNATGPYSVAIGRENKASGNYSVAIGYSNNVSGAYSAAAGGLSNVIAGEYGAVLGGYSNNITSGSDYAAILGGRSNTVNADFAVAFGDGAVADHYGSVVQSPGTTVSNGDAQHIRAITYCSTTSDGAAHLYLNGSSLDLIQPPDSVWMSRVMVTGVRSDGGQGASYYFIYTTRRDGTANCVTTANVQTNPYALVLTEDNTGWNAAMNISGNTVFASAVGTVNASATYRWVAYWEITQVKAS
jgi:hypothetical protein